MKKLLLKFMSVFTAMFIVISVAVVPVSADNDIAGSIYYTSEAISLVENLENIVDNYSFTDEQRSIIDSKPYFIKVILFLSNNKVGLFNYYCDSIPEYDDSSHFFTFPKNTYRLTLTYNLTDCTFFKNYFGTANTSVVGGIEFFDNEKPFFVSKLTSFCDFSYSYINATYPTLYFDNFSEPEKDVDIKVNIDNSSATLPTSIDITENPNFYIDVKNNTDKAIQFVSWISETPASSGAYDSYSKLNWTYSQQQWAYVYHGTWADGVRTALDIYGNIIDTADLVWFCWWKDSLVGAVDDKLPKSYYSQDNVLSPYHFVSPGGNFNQKFSFNTATLSKDKEYYFNVVYRPIVSYEIIDGAIVLLNSVFHDNFSDLNYYNLGYCTTFTLSDNVSGGGSSPDYPSGYGTTITDTKNPVASVDKDGNVSLSGGNNNLDNSINFNPVINNSNDGVTINNNLGGGGYNGNYGDFDGDISTLEELFERCTNFFGFLKLSLTSLLPVEIAVLIGSGFLVVVFLRIIGR